MFRAPAVCQSRGRADTKYMSHRLTTAIALLALAACSSAAHPSLGGLNPNAIRAPQAGTATMLLDEEFTTPKLNTNVWFTCYTWVNPGQRCTNGGNLELEWYEARNVTIANGIANLTADLHPQTKSHPYTSGMIQTGGTASSKSTFAFRYGYAEIRARLPKGAGMWPAFWLVQANRRWPPEIDIMEWQGVDPTTDVVTTHWKDAAGNHQQSSTGVNTGINLWQAYHTYAADWEPNAITWYFDGKPIKRFTEKRWIPDKPMVVIANLAIGGWEKGQLNPHASDFPATFAIDYIRIWNKKP
jgi:beta-glucanase (GH16 family)